MKIAVVDVGRGGERLRCWLNASTRLRFDLRALAGAPGEARGEWVLPSDRAEPLQSLLDRRGYRWALRPADDLPRTWAQRLLAEVPPNFHAGLVDACRRALDGCPDHLAVLTLAQREYADPGRDPLRGG